MSSKRILRRAFPLFLLILAALACGGEAVEVNRTPSAVTPVPTVDGPPRPYRLGFTPFPYDISQEAVSFTYDTLARDADLINHHFDDGVPWPEALAGEPFPEALRNEWAGRREATPAGHQILLTITPINIQRNGLAPYRGARGDMPLPAPWDQHTFDTPAVQTAYASYAKRAVDFFEPDYLCIGIEVNLLLNNRPDLWPAYLELHRNTYTTLRQSYPDLPIFISLFAMDLLDGYRQESDTTAQQAALAEIMPHSDLFALSLYPFMSGNLTEPLPGGFYDDLFALSDKPPAITETGFPAEPLVLAEAGITMPADPARQDAFVARLLREAEQREIRFVVNFVLRDYDALAEKIGDSDVVRVWRDTGLYDEDGNPRPALDTWRAALARPRANR